MTRRPAPAAPNQAITGRRATVSGLEIGTFMHHEAQH